jgi:hypothetical protein
MPHYFATCDGIAYSSVELTAVLANLASVTASWRVLCLNRGDFESGGVVVDRGVVGEFRKTLHPRNVEFNKALETCFSGAGNS